jgi:hypothetical protein
LEPGLLPLYEKERHDDGREPSPPDMEEAPALWGTEASRELMLIGMSGG